MLIINGHFYFQYTLNLNLYIRHTVWTAMLLFLRATKEARSLILVSGFLLTVQRDLSRICPHSQDARVVPTNMHGMWPRRLQCSVKGPCDVTVIMGMHMQVMQLSLLHSIRKHSWFRYTSTVPAKGETVQFALPAWNPFIQESESRD